MIKSLVDIYKREFPSFDEKKYINGYDYNWYKCSLDNNLVGGFFSTIHILENNPESSENDWQASIVFLYEGLYYKCEYSEGSRGSGINLDDYSLKQVFPKTKEVTYYE